MSSAKNESIRVLVVDDHAVVRIGLKTLLSNTSGPHVAWFTSRYRVFDCFRAAIYSHEAGCMKPEPEIFRIAIDRLGLDPAATIYVDDLPDNVAAGAAAGFRAIQYDHEDHAAFLPKWERAVNG